MTFGSKRLITPVAAAGVALALSAGACLAQDAAALARAAQNPIADLVSVPI